MDALATSWDACERMLAAEASTKLQPMTAEQLLFSEEGGPMPQVLLPVGLGRLGQILGLRAGELCEVYGGPATGKTQLGLTVAACAAQDSRPVLFVTVKDHPVTLAERLQTIAISRKMDLAAFEQLHIYQATDFADFARIILRFGETFSQKTSQPLVVVDGLSSLLSPFTSATSWAHRWRLAWAWRSLRQLAIPRGRLASGSYVLILSHTVNENTLALGQQWLQAATRRLELSQGRLELQMAKRGLPVAGSCQAALKAIDLVIGDAGVHEAEM